MVMEHGAMVSSSSSLENQGQPCSIIKTITVATIGAGIQFGWALQLSLLTPYVQTLGVPHTWSSFIWLCGPLSGLLVQPIVGHYSDRCTSKLGRRRPFIIAGAAFVCIAVFLIGYAADIGVATGDSADATSKPRAVAVFVVGFWILDVANNMLQGPCRALLADMSAGNHSRMRTSMSLFSFFIAIGNILGYAAGSYRYLYRILPFTHTGSCDYACANLKTCFMFSVCLLLILTLVAVTSVSETPFVIEEDEEDKHTIPFFGQLFGALRNLNRSMWILLAVTAINWIAWFPWFLFDTDWMGREIYGGLAEGSKEQKNLYDLGVHIGSLGLMIHAVVLAFCSLAVEPASRLFGGAKNLWGFVNMILAAALGMTVYITNKAEDYRQGTPMGPTSEIKAYALSVFGVIGLPLAINFSVPFALASMYCSTSGGGQGLSLGILNLAIVIPQMIVSVSSGPLDDALGGGNLPAFVMGAIAAVISGVAAIFLLPNTPKKQHPEENEE